MEIGTDFFAESCQICVIFALEMHFQHFFPLVNGKLGALKSEIWHDNGMYDDFFTLEIGTTKTFEIESRFVYFVRWNYVAQKLTKHGKIEKQNVRGMRYWFHRISQHAKG